MLNLIRMQTRRSEKATEDIGNYEANYIIFNHLFQIYL